MEILAAKSLSGELEMEEYPINFMYNNCQMNYPEYHSLDQPMNSQSLSFDHDYTTSTNFIHNHDFHSRIPNIVPTELPQVDILPPAKQLKSNKASSPSSSTQLISFENTNPAPIIPYADKGKTCSAGLHEQGMMMTRAGNLIRKSSLSSWEHVIAERNRREKVAQLFQALSALIPGLKKMDKASVLEDAIKYVKHLEERVKTLEEQAAKKTIESVVLISKRSSRFSEIEARVSDDHVMIRIHCEKHEGSNLTNILSEVEKLHLTILHTNVLPFGATSAVHITVVAQMNVNFCLELKNLIRTLTERLCSRT